MVAIHAAFTCDDHVSLPTQADMPTETVEGNEQGDADRGRLCGAASGEDAQRAGDRMSVPEHARFSFVR